MLPTCNWIGKAFHLSIDYQQYLSYPEVNQFLDHLTNDDLYGHNDPFDFFTFAIWVKATLEDVATLQPYLVC